MEEFSLNKYKSFGICWRQYGERIRARSAFRPTQKTFKALTLLFMFGEKNRREEKEEMVVLVGWVQSQKIERKSLYENFNIALLTNIS